MGRIVLENQVGEIIAILKKLKIHKVTFHKPVPSMMALFANHPLSEQETPILQNWRGSQVVLYEVLDQLFRFQERLEVVYQKRFIPIQEI